METALKTWNSIADLAVVAGAMACATVQPGADRAPAAHAAPWPHPPTEPAP